MSTYSQRDPFALLVECLKKDGLTEASDKLHILRHEMAWTTGTELIGEFGQAMVSMRRVVKRGASAETKDAWRESARIVRKAWPSFWNWYFLRM